MKNLKQGRKYEFSWIDCMDDSIWMSVDTLEDFTDRKTKQEFKNIGYFVQSKNGYHIFTQGIHKDSSGKINSYFNITCIPIKQIISLKELKSV